MKYVVLDLEMCYVPNSAVLRDYRYGMETIQIGAVLVNEDYKIEDSFNSYIKPEVGSISSFINHLTGISSYLVKDARCFGEVMKDFMEWLPKDARCVSWSMTDRKQLMEEAAYKDVDVSKMKEMFENWIDAQAMFSEKLNSGRAYRLDEALIASDIYQDGSSHDGYDDAVNTAKLFIRLETEPDYKLNEMYRAAKEDDVEHLSFSLSSVFEGLKVG